MLRLLEQVNAMSSSRDREQISLRLVSAMRDVLSASIVALYAVSASVHGPLVALVAEARRGAKSICSEDDRTPQLDLADTFLMKAVRRPGEMREDAGDGKHRIALAIGEVGNPHALLVAYCEAKMNAGAVQAFRHIAHFYQNQLDLLDYAELDTLTKLLNRKTFDENFDRFLMRAGRPIPVDYDRRNGDEPSERSSWLAVIDIDRFKRINDGFGHLFGDEVLLRVADLMRKSFRQSDKLFRFGGEEFIVLLRHASNCDAFEIFDRFRGSVETHEFPQIGQVTASVGYTRIDPRLPPTEILSRADETLYFSKANGRNQVNCYESLLENGSVKSIRHADNTELQADIDALLSAISPS
ncbi:MAG: GGDEF domain-containing protein [Betaproteobacteria bacterium]|nr:GGDEF domain-containing protein [Betaproteobacteria bacterium]